MNSANIAKTLFFIGLFIMIAAALIWLGSKIGLPLGKMARDIHIKKKSFLSIL